MYADLAIKVIWRRINDLDVNFRRKRSLDKKIKRGKISDQDLLFLQETIGVDHFFRKAELSIYESLRHQIYKIVKSLVFLRKHEALVLSDLKGEKSSNLQVIGSCFKEFSDILDGLRGQMEDLLKIYQKQSIALKQRNFNEYKQWTNNETAILVNIAKLQNVIWSLQDKLNSMVRSGSIVSPSDKFFIGMLGMMMLGPMLITGAITKMLQEASLSLGLNENTLIGAVAALLAVTIIVKMKPKKKRLLTLLVKGIKD
jgi:Mg2+ and Co2+ transporter CorA